MIDQIAEAVAGTLRHRKPEADFTDRNLDLVRDLGADELDRISVAMEIEERFNIEISDQELYRIRTIGELADFVATETGSEAA